MQLSELDTIEDGQIQERRENLFKPLVPDAYRVIRRAMLNQKDSKLGVAVAQDVLDRAGETKKKDEKAVTPIVITDSQVQLLVAGMEEVVQFSKRGAE